jgi:hypothetical protein
MAHFIKTKYDKIVQINFINDIILKGDNNGTLC